MSRSEKLTIAQGICAPLLRKIRADLQRNVDPNSSNDGNGAENEAEDNENEGDHESNVNRLDPRYSSGVSSPGNTISCTLKIHLMSNFFFTVFSYICCFIYSLQVAMFEQGFISPLKAIFILY